MGRSKTAKTRPEREMRILFMATSSVQSGTGLAGWRALIESNTEGVSRLRRKKQTGKEKAKLFLTRRKKSEILPGISEVGHVVSILRSTPRSNPYAVPLS